MSVEDKRPVSGFQNALKAVLRVSKTDLKRMMESEKRAGKPRRGPKPKAGAVAPGGR